MPHLFGVFINWGIPGIRNVAIARLVKNLIAFLTAGHIDACLFFLLNVWEDIGTAWIDTIGIRNFEREVVFLTQYNTSLCSIVYVFRQINTNAERLYTMGEIIIGSIIYGCIFGVLSNFIRAMDTKAALDKKAEKHRFKMDLLRTFLRSKKFPVDLQQKILEHEEFLWIKGQGMDEDELFANLPVSLRQDACNHLYMDMINRVPLFRATDLNFRYGLTRAVKSMVVPENFYVCRAGEASYEMYFVRAGELDVILPAGGAGLNGGGMNTLGLAKTMAKPIRIGPGAYFGELALIDNSRVPVTVRTRTTAELCVLTRESFSELVAAYPPVAEALRQALAQRRAAEARAAADAAQKARASSHQLHNGQKGHGPAALRIMSETAGRLAEKFSSLKRNSSAGGGIRGRLGTLGRGSRAAPGEDGDGVAFSAVGRPLMTGTGTKPAAVAARMTEAHGLTYVDSESRIGMADR
ncbi:cyclic nucleotide-binding-like protein, partial [Catenaria anguillulae PL171]